jgi:FkbM family methyltransferase
VNIFRKLIPHKPAFSYSQCGEDLIINFIFQILQIAQPSFLDLGAHHPTYLSNTYFFYERGCTGVCVEPDPMLHTEIKNKRKKDICLNVGVGTTQQTEADFFLMTSKTLNTFSKEEAERYQAYGKQKIEKVIKLPLLTVNQIINQNFASFPNLISIDIEGLELDILKTFDFSIFKPEVFCVETLTYTEDNAERKLSEVIDYICQNDYFVYADTFINTIFVSKTAWSQRP